VFSVRPCVLCMSVCSLSVRVFSVCPCALCPSVCSLYVRVLFFRLCAVCPSVSCPDVCTYDVRQFICCLPVDLLCVRTFFGCVFYCYRSVLPPCFISKSLRLCCSFMTSQFTWSNSLHIVYIYTIQPN